MNKLTNMVVGIMVPVIGLVSGCMESFGGSSSAKWTPRYQTQHISSFDLSSTIYRGDLEKRAEKLAQSKYLKDKEAAIENYGEICNLEEMDKIIAEISENTENDNGIVFRCMAIGQKYRDRCGTQQQF